MSNNINNLPREIFGSIQQFIPPNRLKQIVTSHSSLPDKVLRGLLFQIQHMVRDILDVLPLLERVTKENEKMSKQGFLTTSQFLKAVGNKDQRQKAYDGAVDHNRPNIALILLRDKREDDFDPSSKDSHAIVWASEKGYVEVVKLLLKDERVDPINEDPLMKAVINGHLEVVKLLLNDRRVLFRTKTTFAERVLGDYLYTRPAAENGHVEIVKELKKAHFRKNAETLDISKNWSDDRFVDPSNHDNQALLLAVKNNQEDKRSIKWNFIKKLLKDKRVVAKGRLFEVMEIALNRDPELLRLFFSMDIRYDLQPDYKKANKQLVFLFACASGDINQVRTLLKSKSIDPSLCDNLAIRLAAMKGRARVVEELLSQASVDPSAKDNSAILYASTRGHEEVVKLLLEDKRADPRVCCQWPLWKAASNGHAGVVGMLLKDHRMDPRNTHAIEYASQGGHIDVVRELLKDNRVTFKDELIVGASVRGRFDLVKVLLTRRSSDSAIRFNVSFLRVCIQNCVEEVKKLLEDKRVDPSVFSNLAIRESSHRGHHMVVSQLLKDSRVDPSMRSNIAIISASSRGHPSVVSLLFSDARVDPSAQDNAAIRRASSNGHVEVVRQLLQHEKVDPAAQHNEAFRYASENGHVGVVKLLLGDKRVDPSAQDNEAIKMASSNGHVGVVKLLFRDKRVHSRPSRCLDRTFELACIWGHIGVVKELLKHRQVTQNLEYDRFIKLAKGYGQLEISNLLHSAKYENSTKKRENDLRREAVKKEKNDRDLDRRKVEKKKKFCCCIVL